MKHFAAILILLLWPLPALAADFTATVVGVSDGDTLTVLTPEKRQVKIRLHGVDAPESGQDFGARAKQAASEMAFGKDVTVREMDRDRYGRTVAEVILPDGRSMNRELVRAGYAWHFVKYAPADRELAALEAEAKAAKRGLWSQPGAVPPWEWRNGQGVPVTAGVVGNRRSLVYHAPNCRGVLSMSEKNRVPFASREEAEKAGYRKAGARPDRSFTCSPQLSFQPTRELTGFQLVWRQLRMTSRLSIAVGYFHQPVAIFPMLSTSLHCQFPGHYLY